MWPLSNQFPLSHREILHTDRSGWGVHRQLTFPWCRREMPVREVKCDVYGSIVWYFVKYPVEMISSWLRMKKPFVTCNFIQFPSVPLQNSSLRFFSLQFFFFWILFSLILQPKSTPCVLSSRSGENAAAAMHHRKHGQSSLKTKCSIHRTWVGLQSQSWPIQFPQRKSGLVWRKVLLCGDKDLPLQIFF